MTSTKYIGMDVHKESISIAVRNSAGKVVMECVIETKASMILQFIDGLRGDLQVTIEEGTSAAWLYDLLKPHVTKLVVCDPRKNKSMREGNQSDAHWLPERTMPVSRSHDSYRITGKPELARYVILMRIVLTQIAANCLPLIILESY